MAADSPNPLVSSSRATDSSPHIQLHPLVLLTISDYVTRHTLRQQKTPVVGAIIGSQNGREVTMEVAFECKTVGDNGEVIIDDRWFEKRLEQYREVYKGPPPLDLVGWFTLGTPHGPQPQHLPIHERLQAVYNESAVFLVFHPSPASEQSPSVGGKLPLTLYESFWETSSNANDKSAMEVDGAPAPGNRQLKFRELSYAVETGEAEMISVDFVARGAGNATAINGVQAKTSAKQAPDKAEADAAIKKGKTRAQEKEIKKAEEEEGPIDESAILSPEDEELLSSLTAKSNAIKMLHSRLHLLQAYLSSLPACYLTDASLPIPTADSKPDAADPCAGLNHQILRSISALLARLPLLQPSDQETFAREALEQRSDVELITLLSSLTNSVNDAKEMGRKAGIVQSGRQAAQNKGGVPPGMERGAGDFFDTVMGGTSGGPQVLGERHANVGGPPGFGAR